MSARFDTEMSTYRLDPATGRIYDLDPATPFTKTESANGPRRRQDDPAAAHDAEHGKPRDWPRIPCAWVPERFAPSEPLTDAIIEKRKAEGYFSDAYHEAVRRTAEAKAARKPADD